MSKIIKSKAFVLNKLDFGDSSKIVNFYSEEFGRVAGIIKGARSSKSKIGKVVDVLNLVEIIFYKKDSRDLQIVSQADLISHYPNIKSDLEKVKYASAIIELVLKLTRENDAHKRLFNGIVKILNRLDIEETEPILLFAMFYKFFIEEIGYGIESEHCSHCNSELSLSKEVLYNYELGFMCSSCGKDHLVTYKFSPELFNKVICLSNRKKKCSYDAEELRSIITFFEKFLIYHIDEYNGLKSLQMY
ncbi:MAG: DNA repair protein RecO [Bacteroidetes bacterium]|nr:DNA repair protein RecO [Bacteroidota bacterium]MBU1116132.1 DNA repair protein RecO [Bacteroidota bacterium]MBU1800424.1 DNA repair protein RecO [Bacteroidota bacterium]